MKQTNADIRQAAKAAKVPFWAIAEYLNMSETMMSRKLRRELPDADKKAIFHAIRDLQTEAGIYDRQ